MAESQILSNLVPPAAGMCGLVCRGGSQGQQGRNLPFHIKSIAAVGLIGAEKSNRRTGRVQPGSLGTRPQGSQRPLEKVDPPGCPIWVRYFKGSLSRSTRDLRSVDVLVALRAPPGHNESVRHRKSFVKF